MQRHRKFLTTGILLLAILIVIFLAAGISNVEFQPGTPVTKEKSENQYQPLELPRTAPIWGKILLALLSVILPISIVLFIKSPEVRKRTFQLLPYVLLYGLIIFALVGKSQEEELANEELESELANTGIIESQREAAEFISTLSEPSLEVSIILDIIIILLVVLLIWYIYRRFFGKGSSANYQLKAEAEGAINEIQAGENIRNVIIRCYSDMSQILNERRGIQRGQAMTPREFEQELQDIGVPYPDVQKLTRLFEAVRYGNADLGQRAEQEAIQCLTAIAKAC